MTASAQRSFVARGGIVALNLLGAGLGLLRLGDRRGFVWLAVQVIGSCATIAIVAATPAFDFAHFVAYVAAVLAVFGGLYVSAMIATWRTSRVRAGSRLWWSRWYGLVTVVVAIFAVNVTLPDIRVRYYRSFYTTSAGMLPTLAVDDRFLVDLRRGVALRRGELVIVPHDREEWAKRIVGLPGDRIALRNGVPVINGIAATIHRVGTMDVPDQPPGVRFRETLPGTTGRYEVIDSGPTAQDEMPEVVVPAGRLFLLGDNRDNSEDSRLPTLTGGLGMVPVSAIVGQPLFIYWSRDRAKIGRSLLGG